MEYGILVIKKNEALGHLCGSVKRLTSAQVMISCFMSSSPLSGSALTVQSLLRILGLPLSLSLPRSSSVSVSLKNKQTLKKIKTNK